MKLSDRMNKGLLLVPVLMFLGLTVYEGIVFLLQILLETFGNEMQQIRWESFFLDRGRYFGGFLRFYPVHCPALDRYYSMEKTSFTETTSCLVCRVSAFFRADAWIRIAATRPSQRNVLPNPLLHQSQTDLYCVEDVCR